MLGSYHLCLFKCITGGGREATTNNTKRSIHARTVTTVWKVESAAWHRTLGNTVTLRKRARCTKTGLKHLKAGLQSRAARGETLHPPAGRSHRKRGSPTGPAGSAEHGERRRAAGEVRAADRAVPDGRRARGRRRRRGANTRSAGRATRSEKTRK